MKYKLLIVDDEEDIRKMLQQYFEILGYLVYTAKDGREALKKVSVNPDLILLDINMPGMDGIEVCKRIRDYMNVPILFLTAKIEEQDRIQGLMAGGDDYILKPFGMEELHARVIAHLRREERGSAKSKIKASGAFIINYTQRKVSIEGKELKLTKTEYDIVEFLSNHRNQIFSKEAIYEKLWGFDKEGDSAIITEHIRRIRLKFAKEQKQEVIETVWGVGYRWII